jgi:ribosomal protein S18 acetylase RimI-like enzyme
MQTGTMAIDIVPIRDGLIGSFHAALDLVCRERTYLAYLEAPPIESTWTFVRDNIAQRHPQLVALADGGVVGWCDVTPSHRPTMRHCGTLGMALLPAWRGRGLGERLMRRTLDAARAFGFSRVELTVRHDNVRAQALYRKLGFEVEGRKRRAVLVVEVFYDLIVMALLFDGAQQV